jgi:hypothetical protein
LTQTLGTEAMGVRSITHPATPFTPWICVFRLAPKSTSAGE